MAQRQEVINQFILLRAQGLSFDKIAKSLKIGRGTCVNWDSKYTREIADRKAAELNALCANREEEARADQQYEQHVIR